MDDKEFSNIFAIPANYTDSGRLLGGMLEIRNTIEAIAIVILIGYPELIWLPVSGTVKVVLMTITLLPLGVVALMGISGDSLLQYCGHMAKHWTRRRKLHYRRIGYRYEASEIKGTAREKRVKKQKPAKRNKVDGEKESGEKGKD